MKLQSTYNSFILYFKKIKQIFFFSSTACKKVCIILSIKNKIIQKFGEIFTRAIEIGKPYINVFACTQLKDLDIVKENIRVQSSGL